MVTALTTAHRGKLEVKVIAAIPPLPGHAQGIRRPE